MKNYNKSFNVEITANMIADKFHQKLAEFGKDNKDKNIQAKADKLIDSIVGPMCSNDNTNGLKHLYFGLFDLDIEAPLFKDTDRLISDDTHYGWHQIQEGIDEEGEPTMKWTRDRIKIGQCKVVGFDTYRNSNKYEIEYDVFDSKGVVSKERTWTNERHLELASDHVEEKTGE